MKTMSKEWWPLSAANPTDQLIYQNECTHGQMTITNVAGIFLYQIHWPTTLAMSTTVSLCEQIINSTGTTVRQRENQRTQSERLLRKKKKQ